MIILLRKIAICAYNYS